MKPRHISAMAVLLALSLALNYFFITHCQIGNPDRVHTTDIGANIGNRFSENPSEEQLWADFIEALIWQESRGNAKAVGSKDDVGVLQITPVIIADVNRILGQEVYTLTDRTDRDKSILIFNIIQNQYNPDHDINLAMKIWNSKAPVSYHRNVLNKIREIENQREI